HRELGVMTESRKPTRVEPRLLRTEFRGVQPEYDRHSFRARERCERAVREPIRQEPEVASPGYWDRPAQCPRGRPRQLHDRPAAGSLQHSRMPRRSGSPVTVMRDGEDARVVAKSKLAQDVECPKGSRRDGVARPSIPKHGRTDGVLEDLLRTCSFLSEYLGGLAIHELMAQSVTGDFVPLFGNRPDQRR